MDQPGMLLAKLLAVMAGAIMGNMMGNMGDFISMIAEDTIYKPTTGAIPWLLACLC